MENSAELTPDNIRTVGNILNDKTRPLAERFRALFTLRNIGGPDAVRAICDCFDDSSALLKHELAYCLGQMQDKLAISVLCDVLQNTEEDTMVRHEAGEALGAIGSNDVVEVLEKFCADPIPEVAETCQLAVQRIKWLQSEEATADSSSEDNVYKTVDPAPPFNNAATESLQAQLLNENDSLFSRYRAMFALRNKGDEESVLALAEGLKCSSALFRHEIAYVLGQMQHPAAVEQLKVNLENEAENYMVRHECAEALGAIATDCCMDLLKVYLGDKERVVKESCEVALDMAEYERSGNFQYADSLSRLSDQV